MLTRFPKSPKLLLKGIPTPSTQNVTVIINMVKDIVDISIILLSDKDLGNCVTEQKLWVAFQKTEQTCFVFCTCQNHYDVIFFIISQSKLKDGCLQLRKFGMRLAILYSLILNFKLFQRMFCVNILNTQAGFISCFCIAFKF